MSSKGQETRNHILQESRKLFTAHGFQNSSVSEIMSATGVKKGNLYYHFPSKEALGIAVLEDAAEEFAGIIEHSLAGTDPLQRIMSSCRAILDLMQQDNFVGGCLFGNTALEMSGSSQQFRQILIDVFDGWSQRLVHELVEARTLELLNSRASDTTLSTAIIAVLEGGIMLSRVYEDKKALEECIASIAILLQTH